MSVAAREQELVCQLRDVVGVDDEDARRLLEATDWVVADAAALHFAALENGVEEEVPRNGGGSPTSDAAPRPESPTAASGASTTEGESSATQPSEPPGWLGALSGTLTKLGQAVMGVASEDFEQWFATRYGAPTPTFCKECFGEAVRSALDDNRLLLLWFHQEDGLATEKLCREILQSELVLPLLQRSFCLWAGDVSRFEPGQIARLLGATVFPTLVVAQPLRNGFDAQSYGLDSFLLEWPLGTFAQPLFRFSPTQPGQPVNPDEVVAALTSTAEDHHEARQSRQEAVERRNSQLAEERRLREEQDREFQESLLMDQLAAARANDEAAMATAVAASMSSAPPPAAPGEAAAAPSAAAAEAAEDAASQRARAEEEAAQRVRAEEEERAEAQRVARGTEILAQREPEPAGSATARLQVRLPSGERLQRVFLAGQRLEEVFEWAHCCRAVAQPPLFELRTNFPTRALTDRSATLEELGLVPSAVLVLKAVED